MPLFGRKHNDKAKADAGYDNTGYEGQTDYNNNSSGVTGSGGGNLLHKDQHAHAHNDPLYPSPNAPGGGYGQQQRGANVGGGAPHQGGFNTNTTSNDPYVNAGQPGYGAGGAAGATGGAARHGMAPQTDKSGNPVHPHGGGGSRLTGKVESVMGSVFGSESLKRKGLEKEQESESLKVQAAELGEAERLEQAALARRQRAVAHGAHPEHQHLGGHNPGAGAPNVNELGGGANTGIGGVGGAGSGARGGY